MNSSPDRSAVILASIAIAAAVAGLAIGVLRALAADGSAAPSSGPAHSTTTRSVKEADLNIVTLSEEADKRLIRTASVELKEMPRSRLYGGEVVVKPGHGAVMTAPFAGTMGLPSGAEPPTPGSPVTKGAAVFELRPLLTAEMRATIVAELVEAQGEESNADVQLKAATIAVNRAKQLFSDKAGTERALDEAQAAFDLADRRLLSAKSRVEVLSKMLNGAEKTPMPPFVLMAPADGVLRAVHVAAGQTVPAGAPLFEVIDARKVWVRVSVYAGDAGELASDAIAKVVPLGKQAFANDTAGKAAAGHATPDDRPHAAVDAVRTPAPPPAREGSTSLDIFFEMENGAGAFKVGERVAVTLPMSAKPKSLVVPWSAVTFDVNGGAWVYRSLGGRQYARHRVQVQYVHGTDAVLASGPAPDTAVVVQGVAELFGREMGFAK